MTKNWTRVIRSPLRHNNYCKPVVYSGLINYTNSSDMKCCTFCLCIVVFILISYILLCCLLCTSIYQHWTKISKPTGLSATICSLEWPEGRYSHAATCVSGPLLVIMGGVMFTIASSCWIYDFTAMLWKKVHVMMYFRNSSEIDVAITFFSYPSLTQWLNEGTTHSPCYNYHHTLCGW